MLKKMAALTGAIALFVAFPALAQQAAQTADSHVTVPWGDYGAALITAIGAAGTWLAGAALGLLPGPAQWAARTFKVDQIIGRSIEAAAHDLAAQIQGKGFTVDVRNQLLAQTLRNVQANAASFAAAHGPTLELKAKARIESYINSLTAKK